MSQKKSKILRKKEKEFKEQIIKNPVDILKMFIDNDSLAVFAEACDNKRDCIFNPITTLSAFIYQSLSSDGSCQNAVAKIIADRIEQGQEPCSPATGGYCKARQKLDCSAIQDIMKSISFTVQKKAPKSWLWNDFRVKIVDGTTVTAADTKKNQEQFPQRKEQDDGVGFPIIRIVALISLACGEIIDYSIAPYAGKGTGEMSLFHKIQHNIHSKDLLMGDKYYSSYTTLAMLLQKDSEGLFKQHAARSKSDFRKGRKLGKNDHIITMKKPKKKPSWMSYNEYRSLPDEIEVREFKHKGEVYVTTLLDNKKYTKKELVDLYKYRWQVELTLNAIKTTLGMDFLPCQTPDMLEKEIAVYFLGYNMIRSLMVVSAIEHDLCSYQLSFKATLQLLLQFSPVLKNAKTRSGREQIFNILVDTMAKNKVGMRPNRIEPRKRKRRPKGGELMHLSREEERQKISSKFATEQEKEAA